MADRLNAAGIRAHVFNQHAASIVGDIPVDASQPQVWIEREADRERALLLLARLDDEASRGGSTTCARCGEDSPANFELCWNCGAALAG